MPNLSDLPKKVVDENIVTTNFSYFGLYLKNVFTDYLQKYSKYIQLVNLLFSFEKKNISV